jgi:uncharacterized protein (TIGR04255 family)
MNVPKKITPCPIVDCTIDLRFRTPVEPGAVFGIIYNAFKQEYPKVEKMPVLNIPEQMRLVDPNLQYQPWYRLRNGDFILAVGPKHVALHKPGEYPGWGLLSERLLHMVQTLNGVAIVDKVERAALRYINFFDFDIFEKVKLVVSIENKPITSTETLVRSIFSGKRFNSLLHISNLAIMKIKGTERKGSVIDIDTSLDKDLDDFFRNSASILEEGHAEEKLVFFGLLKNDFLGTLNPEY